MLEVFHLLAINAILLLPFIFVTQVGYQEISSHGNHPDYSVRYFVELIFLLGLAQLGSMGLKKLNIPSAPILAAMILCGIFYTFEITTARFPDFFINIAFVLYILYCTDIYVYININNININ